MAGKLSKKQPIDDKATASTCCSFSQPIKDTLNRDQWEPAIVASKVRNVIHITAYDRRNDANNILYRPYDYYCYNDSFVSRSSQEGWFNQQISSVDSANKQTSGNTWFLDDYHGIATSTVREAYTVWTDSRNINGTNAANFDIYSDRTKS
ncbi:hypothetical protein NTE_01991 [Candidatus Nitrososphaera evergladensis SR1]|uniref:Uncharacterized protein n=1 Tax=Candidatus Nitrososphaera evergladensis SR1 TaxID=1459636 RepID=A0A075MXM2_9ARCH|nr:hypothetical protein [Candidatus Nitrososphaera evergladensis]AIF84049.1 hypothetical protein NTE_01991 [Candidatus Nitrososphaera evergladensis SR1]